MHFVPSHASSRSAEVPKLGDIRESTWDVYHGKFPQATSRRFRRPTSAPGKVCFRQLSVSVTIFTHRVKLVTSQFFVC